ncbi:sulfite exporter TauE/SafE family protein [Mariprofundus erugo]|uniref:sulfite exporter TauE/SafE family protein n=1 Tax=Mariprofundus erugo TaxID=2528639 RepID=UPI0010FD45C0|nr:sulfite exporter TauE/SafE family protein [Mariprofundus erugo]TLS77573.1 sulfite exporter TauE/SafE family protein [Mariprofundus erugo]
MFESLLLFVAAFVAAAISGAAGFGGALLLLPLLVATVGVDKAVPLLTVAQFVGNLSRVGFGFSQIHWRPVSQFLLAAIPCSALGALSFVQLPQDLVIRVIGLLILVFVMLKYFGWLHVGKGPLLLLAGGAVTGFLSGLAGSAGPLGAAVFLSLGLPPVAYIASEAVTALVMHGVKSVIYQHYLQTDMQFWILAAIMSCAMVLGTWSAKRVIERMPRERFQQYVAILLAAIALYMIVHG